MVLPLMLESVSVLESQLVFPYLLVLPLVFLSEFLSELV
jgi:hypothetical protein